MDEAPINIAGYRLGVAAITAARTGTPPRDAIDALTAEYSGATLTTIVEAIAEIAIGAAVTAFAALGDEFADEQMALIGTTLAVADDNYEGE